MQKTENKSNNKEKEKKEGEKKKVDELYLANFTEI